MSRRLAVVLALLVAAPAAHAQDPDDDAVALAYHKLTNTPLDVARIAERSESVRRASSFDKRDVLAAEVARLERALAAADLSRELVARIHDYVTPYDHDRGEFSIQLFTPGYFVSIHAFGEPYRLVFANADSSRAIPMPKEEARQFDAMLERRGRRVITEARYRIIGSGDPSGAVTGARVVRAELLAARLLDDAGRVLYVPRVVPLPANRAAGGVTLAGAAADAAPFDAHAVDVAGFRVGVKGKDLEATLARLYGATVRRSAGRDAPPGIVAVVAHNEGLPRDPRPPRLADRHGVRDGAARRG